MADAVTVMPIDIAALNRGAASGCDTTTTAPQKPPTHAHYRACVRWLKPDVSPPRVNKAATSVKARLTERLTSTTPNGLPSTRPSLPFRARLNRIERNGKSRQHAKPHDHHQTCAAIGPRKLKPAGSQRIAFRGQPARR